MILASILALVASGCAATTDDGYIVADRVLEQLGEPSGTSPEQPLGAQAGCEVIEEVDEYGFVTEVSTCDDNPEQTAETVPANETNEPDETETGEADELSAEQLLNATGDLPLWALPTLAETAPIELRPLLLSMSATVDALDQACGSDFGSWRSLLRALADEVDEMALLIADGKGADYVGTVESRALTRALMERSLAQTGCKNPGGGDRFTDAELVRNSTYELTSRASIGLSDLSRLLGDTSSGYLFHFFTTADNYEWLRTQTENVDLIVYGTSQAGAAIDVPGLAQQMSANAGNAFLYGSLAEVQQHWFPEVERYVDADTVVWLVGAIDLLIDCDPVGREAQFTDRIARRQRTFQASGWFGDVDYLNVVLGVPGPPNTNKGNGIKEPAPDPAALENHENEYRDRFANAQFCKSRAETIKTSVERMANDNRRVVVVGMPLSPIAYGELPGGPAAVAEAMELLAQEFGDVPVDVVDMSSTLQSQVEIWVDYTHLTEGGAVQFTELLAAELKALGL